MKNFTELLNKNLVNPIKQRLSILSQANKENKDSFTNLKQNLSDTNERQAKIDKDLKALMEKVEKIEGEFKEYQNRQNSLISAFEELKWDDGELNQEAVRAKDNNLQNPDSNEQSEEPDKLENNNL